LVPLKDKKKKTIARALLEIFSRLGAPKILQSDNGGEFSGIASWYPIEEIDIDGIIEEIADLWPMCKMVKGRPRHSESNGGVERLNQLVQVRLSHWCKQQKTKKWTVGIPFVRWAINTTVRPPPPTRLLIVLGIP
jgi:hypothetical protein